MNPSARARLVAAGWRDPSGRPSNGLAERMRQLGWTPFPAVRAFLDTYGGLLVTAPPRRGEYSTRYFHTLADEVPTDPSWTRVWEDASGTRTCPIGETAFGDYILVMDEHGRVFGMDMTLEMTYWADDADGLFDLVLAHDWTFRPVDADDRRPLPGPTAV